MKYEDMLNTITLGDSYKIIKEIPDNSIDCIYTDIPYLIDNFGGGTSKLAKRITQLNREQIGFISNGIDYNILKDFIRVLKKINIFIWCSKNQILDLMEFFNQNECYCDILVWCKTNPAPNCNNNWISDLEYCLYFREKRVHLNDGYELKSKWYCSSINKADKEKYKHPTIKPLELVKRHILHATQKNDIVLDCFSGSGTTCVAAKETGRQFIGIEIEPEYHKISLDRLNGILANGQISFDTDINKI